MRQYDRQPYAKLIQILDVLTSQLYDAATMPGMVQNRTRSEYRYLEILRACHMIVRGSTRGQWTLQDDVLTPCITDQHLIQIAALVRRLNHDHPLLYLNRLHEVISHMASNGSPRPAEIDSSLAYMIDIIETAVTSRKKLVMTSTDGRPTRFWPIDLTVDQTNSAILLCSARQSCRDKLWYLTRQHIEFSAALGVEDGETPMMLPDTHRLNYLCGLIRARKMNHEQQQLFLSLRDQRVALLLVRLNANRITGKNRAAISGTRKLMV